MEKVKKMIFLLVGIGLFGGELIFVICEGNCLMIVVNIIVLLIEINLEVMIVFVNEIICILYIKYVFVLKLKNILDRNIICY